MERDINRQQSDYLVRKIISEREKFVWAWQQGAGNKELNEIRANIKELDDLLWETTSQHGKGSQPSKPDAVLTEMRKTA
jgi:hypothetical protein